MALKNSIALYARIPAQTLGQQVTSEVFNPLRKRLKYAGIVAQAINDVGLSCVELGSPASDQPQDAEWLDQLRGADLLAVLFSQDITARETGVVIEEAEDLRLQTLVIYEDSSLVQARRFIDEQRKPDLCIPVPFSDERDLDQEVRRAVWSFFSERELILIAWEEGWHASLVANAQQDMREMTSRFRSRTVMIPPPWHRNEWLAWKKRRTPEDFEQQTLPFL